MIFVLLPKLQPPTSFLKLLLLLLVVDISQKIGGDDEGYFFCPATHKLDSLLSKGVIHKVENILKGSLDSISSPSVKIMGGKV